MSGANIAAPVMAAISARPTIARGSDLRRRQGAMIDGRLSLPTTMMPEVLLGILPHDALQHSRIAGNRGVDVSLTVAGVSNRNRLDLKAIMPVRQPNRHRKDDRGAESDGEDRRAARGLGGSSEKWHERRRESLDALVGDECDEASIAQGA